MQTSMQQSSLIMGNHRLNVFLSASTKVEVDRFLPNVQPLGARVSTLAFNSRL
jgi:hypothetical protein